MNWDARYYQEKLYPFQDGVLRAVNGLKLPLYLTGGTALSRYYYSHRYSDDLDLFVNRDPKYKDHTQRLFARLEQADAEREFLIDRAKIRVSEDFMQIILVDPYDSSNVLKLDVVNDVAAHFGRMVIAPVLGRIDSIRNILSNKISALFRFAPKDVVDLVTIARRHRFVWKHAVHEAQQKEGGVDPLLMCDILGSFPLDSLSTIRWINPVDREEFRRDLQRMVQDIAAGRSNSLVAAS